MTGRQGRPVRTHVKVDAVRPVAYVTGHLSRKRRVRPTVEHSLAICPVVHNPARKAMVRYV